MQGAIPDPCTSHQPKEGPRIELNAGREDAVTTLFKAAHRWFQGFHFFDMVLN
jgi:hypothetical protein